MTCIVRGLGVTSSEYYGLPSTSDCLDLSQRGLDNEGEGSVQDEGRSGLRESGVEEPLRQRDTGSCQWDMPPLEELLTCTGEGSLLRDGPHGLTEKSVGLPPPSPLSLVDRYLIAL